MTLILSGTNGVSDIDGDASTPAVRGTDANSGIFFGADTVGVSTGGSEKVSVGASAVVVNDGGADVDFRVEGDTEPNLLFVDASTDRVGVGTSSPTQRLTVAGAINSTTGGITATGNNGSSFIGDGFFSTARVDGMFISQAANGPMIFNTNNTERMRILASGGLTFNGDTAAANALDDYEEGTWTPTDASGAGLTLTVSGTPRYVKIGRFVFFNVDIVTYPSTASALTASVGGLPFTLDSNNHGTLSFVADTTNASAGLSVGNTTNIFFYANGTTSASTNANLSGATIYGISGCYQVP